MDQYEHGIVIRDQSNSTYISEMLSFDHINRELIFSDFVHSTNLYWQLPYQFLGNKITSYGGHLNYTFRFQGNLFPKVDKIPDAILSGNSVTLHYFHDGVSHPLGVNKMSIPLFEHEWRMEDGLISTRQDLMLALSNLDQILLRATITNDISSIHLIKVSLDSTVERNGINYGGDAYSPVYTVEKCHCPVGYTGSSCEQCAPGYRRTNDPNENFGYVDIKHRFKCEPCFCNGHSNDCDPENGHCIVSIIMNLHH